MREGHMFCRVQSLLILGILIIVMCFNASASSKEDADGDDWSDYHEESCGTDPNNGQDFPQDTDSSGICDYLDPDDDNDGWWDHIEIICGSDSLLMESVPIDVDDNGICDSLEGDTDGDGLFEYIFNSQFTDQNENVLLALQSYSRRLFDVTEISLPGESLDGKIQSSSWLINGGKGE